MKKKRRKSLRYRIAGISAGALILICAIIMGYNFYIYEIMETQVEQTIVHSLEFYTEELSFALDNTEDFLVKQCLNRDMIRKIKKPRKEIDRYLTIADMQKLFRNSLSSYNMMDGLFLYDLEHAIYIGNSKLYGNTDYVKLINGSMGKMIRKFEQVATQEKNEWFSVKIGDDIFLVKMYEIQNVYIGSWVHVNTLLEKLEKVSVDKKDHILMLDIEQEVLKPAFPVEKINLEQKSIEIDGVRYKKILPDVSKEHFSLMVLKNQQHFWNYRHGKTMQIPITGALIFLISFLMILVQKNLLNRPIETLVNAMNQLKEGNMEIRLKDENEVEEFQILNDTFDRMTQEIKKLKIDVYEETINKQRAELLYLQEQINPHFLTNCMNLIRNLSIKGKNDKVQQAAVLVSNHMRYALAGSTLVTLQKEMCHVANYEKLQKMRYEDQFRLDIKMDESLRECYVPTMLIQVFVDNAVKHQLDPDTQLVIEVDIEKIESDRISILIRDSGDGFSEKILEQLQRKEKCRNEDGEHIGIYNVCQRLEILYGEEAEIQFFNGEEWGACILMKIPFSLINKQQSGY